MFYSLVKPNKNLEFYINSNSTILYLYNKKKNEIKRIFRDKWSSIKVNVQYKNQGELEKRKIDLKTIIDEECDFIKICQVVSSTMKPMGYFEETDEFDLEYSFLNEFLGSKTFIDSKKINKFKGLKVIETLQDKTPFTYLLLKNLFHNEEDIMIINFINWLNVVGFQDKNQDIIFSFIGTTEENQGQGAGKGVLIQLLNKIFSGLVVSVSNTNYMNNFNSNLMNKKIIVFDEVEYKKLKYDFIKDITGSPLFRVEYKGKEPIESNNVSSWLMFSNEHDLCDKISIEDRRMFIIRPNPKNDSLKRIVEDMGIDTKSFVNKLFSEIEDFIHIISMVPGKVLNPTQLVSNGHKSYFKEKRKVSVLDIDNLYKTFTNKDFKYKLYDILDNISMIDYMYKDFIEECKKVIDNDCINFKTFGRIFDYLKEFDYIPKIKKVNVEWEIMKEKLSKNGYQIKKIDSRKSKNFERYKDTIIVKTENYDTNKTKINSLFRDIYGLKITNINDFMPEF